MYDINEFYERLMKLRLNKGVSLREMSLSLGQSEHYMKGIENKSSFPSMSVFFNICDYFGVHPKDFFSDAGYPQLIQEINDSLKKMNEDQLSHIAAIAKDIVK